MNTFKRAAFAAMAILGLLASGCTKIETGHVGVRYGFSGNVEQTPLAQGWHQVFVGDVRSYVANEITMEIKDLHPQTKDRSTLSDLDLTYTYTVNWQEIPSLITKFKGRDIQTAQGDWLPLGQYIQNVVTTATTDTMSQYNALEANERREDIRNQIKIGVGKLLAEEKMQDTLKVHQIFIKNLQIDGRVASVGPGRHHSAERPAKPRSSKSRPQARKQRACKCSRPIARTSTT
jgi:hypothetical protein